MSKSEWSQYWRSSELSGVEAIHASYIRHAFPKHSHNAYTITYVEKGAMGLENGGRRYAIAAGQIGVVLPGDIHTGYAATEDGWTFRSFYFPEHFLEDLCAELIGTSHQAFEFANEPFRDLELEKQICHARSVFLQQKNSLEQSSLLYSIFSTLMTRHAKRCRPLRKASGENQAVELVRDYLHSHYLENLQLQDLANLVDLHPVYLLRAFRKVVGLPPHSYQRQLRIERAKQLLSAGVEISQVAYVTGFADQSHFTRHFRRLVGVTPLKYQKSS